MSDKKTYPATVRSDYTATYADPLVAATGDRVRVGKQDLEWGFVWATHETSGKSGWVPPHFLERPAAGLTRMRRAYDAHELNARAGEHLAVSEFALGWYWATNSSGTTGAIPLGNVDVSPEAHAELVTQAQVWALPHRPDVAFGYVIVYVPSVSDAVAFYTSAFGWLPRYLDAGGDYAELDTGATVLAFAAHSLAQTNIGPDYAKIDLRTPPVGLELAFVVPDVAAAFARAVAAGAIAVATPKTKPWGQVVAYVRASEGSLIELCSALDA